MPERGALAEIGNECPILDVLAKKRRSQGARLARGNDATDGVAVGQEDAAMVDGTQRGAEWVEN